MKIVSSDTAPPNFFLIGLRAPPGQPFDAAHPNAQKVGTVVTRSRIRLDGAVADPGDVLKQDEPYPTFPADGPFRLETDIVTFKPVLDVVVIDRLENVLTPVQQLDLGPPPNTDAVKLHLAGSNFGTVSVDRGGGFGAAVARPFGWLGRGRPPRLPLAGRTGPEGDPASLTSFDASQFDLPDDYDNGFQSGQPLAGQAPLSSGNRLRFNDAAGPVNTVTVPPAPRLALSQDGQPLAPPVTLEPRVDTVVMDRGNGEVTFTWRAVFAWEDRLAAATLEIG